MCLGLGGLRCWGFGDPGICVFGDGRDNQWGIFWTGELNNCRIWL